jgi:hypothetical protein
MLVPTSLPAQCIDDGEYGRHTTRKQLERGPDAIPALGLDCGPLAFAMPSRRVPLPLAFGQFPVSTLCTSAFRAAALCHGAMLASLPHRKSPAGIRAMAESGHSFAVRAGFFCPKGLNPGYRRELRRSSI